MTTDGRRGGCVKSYPGTVRGIDEPQPYTYVERVAEVLQSNRGKRVHLQGIIGGDPWTLHEAVEVLREFGWVIIGERGKAGYMYVRWQRPRRWQRIERVCRSHVAAVVVYPPRQRRRRQVAGQLEMEASA